MKKSVLLSLVAVFFQGLFFEPCPLHAQTVIGQYEDEAPFQSWNALGISSGLSLGMGDARFTLTDSPSACFLNPSLLSFGADFSVVLSVSNNSAQFFKYGPVNTGVLLTGDRNISSHLYTLDFVGVLLRHRRWGIGVGSSLMEIYNRPGVMYEDSVLTAPAYTFNFSQTGLLRSTNLLISREISGRLSAGLALNFIHGTWEKTMTEDYFTSGRTISDEKSQDFSGFNVHGGITFRPVKSFTVSAVFRTPFTIKGSAQSLLRYYSPLGNTDYRIQAQAQNEYPRPLMVGMGIDYRFSHEFRFTSDVSFFKWENYKIRYFDEEYPRNFKNVIRLNTGVEFAPTIRLFGSWVKFPLRAGMIIDPQPMHEPDVTYTCFTFGSGMQWNDFYFDFAILSGKEKGSGRDLETLRGIITFSFRKTPSP